MRKAAVFCLMIVMVTVSACAGGGGENIPYEAYDDTYLEGNEDSYLEEGQPGTSPFVPAAPSPVPPTGVSIEPIPLIRPEDITYLGAFRLPDDFDYEHGWYYGGSALAFYSGGDPYGPDDGFPGSLFGTGHDWNQYIAEVSIPVPLMPDGDLDNLNTAEFLQPFSPLRDLVFDQVGYWELPRVGLEILPPQGEQTSPKLYFAWGQHYQEEGPLFPFGWAELDLGDPQPAGGWGLGGVTLYAVNDYLFSIDPAWAELFMPGYFLGAGRYRDGGWGGQGPNLFALAPWLNGNPPAEGTSLPFVTLLSYGTSPDESPYVMDNYHHSDEWSGGAWLSSGDYSSVIFVGTKGLGEYWYGFGNGVVWPDDPPYPDIPDPPFDDRGWWSTEFQAQIIFYDPADLAAVALGKMQPWEPQPYAVLDLDPYLYNLQDPLQKYRTGAVAFDRENGYLYITQPLVDEDKPIVHVFKVEVLR